MLAVNAVGLVKRYEDVVALDRADLCVHNGTIHGLVGPNGAGKTTLLGMLFGLIRPDAGSIEMLGREFSGAADPEMLDGIAGFVEAPRFYPYLSARENLRLLAAFDDASPTAIGAVLQRVGLQDAAGRNVGGYSVGMRQRLGIAAALLRNPRLLILDEPASGLDPAGLRDLRSTIAELAASGTTVLLSSHDIDEIEGICDEVTIMRNGTAVLTDSIAGLRQRAPDPAFTVDTGDNDAALQLALAQKGVSAARGSQGGLVVNAKQERLDAFIISLGKADIAVRGLTLESTPLRSLFFTLTEGDEVSMAGDEPAPVRVNS